MNFTDDQMRARIHAAYDALPPDSGMVTRVLRGALTATPRQTPRWWLLVGPATAALLVAVIVGAAVVHKTARDGGSASACVVPASEADGAMNILHHAQQAIDCSNGYRVTVSGHNLVIPQWGGIDSGTVDIGAGGLQARASLVRTGDGLYSMWLVEGQTFFQRETCDHAARISGGGNDVLRPFLWGRTHALDAGATGATVLESTTPGVVRVAATLPDLGAVTITVDTATGRPISLQKDRDANSGSVTSWTFSGWGSLAAAPQLPTNVGDQGPGGNPC